MPAKARGVLTADAISKSAFILIASFLTSNKYNWELRWEDLYGFGDRDYNDVVVKVKVRPY